MCIDSPIKHQFTFTPAFSLFVDCQDETEFDRAFAALSEGGGVLMPRAITASAASLAGSMTGSVSRGR